MRKTILYSLISGAAALLALGYVVIRQSPDSVNQDSFISGMGVRQMAEYHYGDDVRRYANELNLPYEYCMALIVLECSGRYPAGNRYEPHIFTKLEEVRNGQRNKFENIRRKDLRDASDEALQNLATSWGPFQLMGYKCIKMDVSVSDIRGRRSVYYGMKWIKEEYGEYLSKGKFKDAFHIHNTGRKFPRSGISRTHDPKYVDKGLGYMKYFASNQ